MNATDTPAPIRTAPLALWRVAQAFLGVLHVLFGDPEAVATRHTLTAKAHAHMASWLRCAEALLRRLILIEASAYPKPNTRPLLHPRRARARKLMGFSPDKPEEWRVSFRCFASPMLRKGRADAALPRRVPLSFWEPKRRRISREDRWCADNWKPVTFRSAWPLAERYEALIRVFNDPTAYGRRLARRLHATPHRLGEALKAPPDAADRVDRFDEIGECAQHAWAKHFSSA